MTYTDWLLDPPSITIYAILKRRCASVSRTVYSKTSTLIHIRSRNARKKRPSALSSWVFYLEESPPLWQHIGRLDNPKKIVRGACLRQIARENLKQSALVSIIAFRKCVTRSAVLQLCESSRCASVGAFDFSKKGATPLGFPCLLVKSDAERESVIKARRSACVHDETRYVRIITRASTIS